MNIDSLLETKGIAVVGASPGKYFSDRLFENLKKTKSKVALFPVSPGKKNLYGMKCYPSLSAVGGKCSAAFILVEIGKVPAIIDECAAIGIRSVVVVDSGEKDPAAAADAAERARKADILLLGPGSLGCIDVPRRLVFYAGRIPGENLPAGRVSVIADSGGLINEFFRACYGEKRWGIKRAFSVGEQLIVSIADLLRRSLQDPMTGCTVLLLSRMRHRMELVAAAEESSRCEKPVVIFPAFRVRSQPSYFPAGDTIDPDKFDGLFVTALAGRGRIFLVDSVESAAEASGAMSPGGIEKAGEKIDLRWEKIAGKKVCAVSVSAGVGRWIKTRGEERGLLFPPVPRKLRQEISAIFPEVSLSSGDIVDLSGRILSRPDVLPRIIETLARSKFCHAVIVAIHPSSGRTPSDRRNEKWLEAITDLELHTLHDDTAAIIPVQVGSGGPLPTGDAWRRARPVRGLDLALDLVCWAGEPRATDPPDHCRQRPSGTDDEKVRNVLRGPARRLSEPSSRLVLAAYGIPFADWILARSPTRAASFVKKIGRPVTLTLATPDIPEQREEDFRIENIRTETAVRKAYIDLLVAAGKIDTEIRIVGMLVEPFHGTNDSLRVASFSPRGDSPPLLLAAGAGSDQIAVGICPLGSKESLLFAQNSLRGSPAESKFEPVATAELLRRLAFLAWDFREEISCMRCHFAADSEGKIVCTHSSVIIGRKV